MIDAVKVGPQRLKALLKNLIDIYSPSGKEEEIVTYLEGYLSSNGLTVSRQEIDEARANLIVLPADKERVELFFIGHVDTVTAYDLETYSSVEDAGSITGLGASDMKAGCAAIIEAFIALNNDKTRNHPVALALVVGEEEDSDGARALTNKYHFPWAIVAEPTNLVPCLGHYGYLEVLLRTKGKIAHSSMPELGQNAIENMLRLLLRFTDYAVSSSHGLVYNIRELSGFPGGFVVPNICEAWLDLHVPPDSRVDILKTEIERLVENTKEMTEGPEAYIRFENTHSGYLISEERPLVQVLKMAYNRIGLPWEPQSFRSHSDGNVLWAAGVDPIILGPSRLELAHTPDESVLFSQVVTASELYLDFALSI